MLVASIQILMTIFGRKLTLSLLTISLNIVLDDSQLERIANGGTVTVTLAEDYYEVRA